MKLRKGNQQKKSAKSKTSFLKRSIIKLTKLTKKKRVTQLLSGINEETLLVSHGH